MNKVIVFIIFIFGCGANESNQLHEIEKIALAETPRLIDSLGINKGILELHVTKEDECLVGDMFLSGPYLKGQKLPSFYHKFKYPEGEISLLIYIDNIQISQKDSLVMMHKLEDDKLVVDNVLEWTLSQAYSTHDLESFKIFFCNSNIKNYTVNTRLQYVEDKMIYPECF